MKYLIILIILSGCRITGAAPSDSCVYHNWQDNDPHCGRYNLVSVRG